MKYGWRPDPADNRSTESTQRPFKAGARHGRGPGSYQDLFPHTFCVYVLDREVGGYHRGYVLRDAEGRICGDNAKKLLSRVQGLFGPKALFTEETGKRWVLQPLKHLRDNIWIGRSTGATV